MKLESNQDIEAPIDFVFQKVTDFDSFARQAMRRGAEVARLDALNGPCAGMTWETRFNFRGKRRDMTVRLAELQRPSMLRVEGELKGMKTQLQIDLLQLSPRRTRLHVSLELMPQSLAARLLVQSLKLARNNLMKRMNKRLKQFARDTEESFSRSA